MDACEVLSCIRGYHVYMEIWNPVVGEHLSCKRERGNGYDRYAVAERWTNCGTFDVMEISTRRIFYAKYNFTIWV